MTDAIRNTPNDDDELGGDAADGHFSQPPMHAEPAKTSVEPLPVVIVDESFHDTMIVNVITGEVRAPVLGQPLRLGLGDVLGTLVRNAPENRKQDHAKNIARLRSPEAQMLSDRPAGIDRHAAKRLAQVRALDDAGVPNCRRAIAEWLSSNWAARFGETYGEHDRVDTIAKWRSVVSQPQGRSGHRDRIRRLRRARQRCRDSAFTRTPRPWLPGSGLRDAA